MAGASLYEKGNASRDCISNGATCFGRITQVYPEERMCEIKTFGAPGPLNDLSLKVQWLTSDANPDGDESSTIPRTDSICAVTFIGGEGFIIGFLKPIGPTGSAANPNEDSDQEELNEGDKVIKTVGKNKIIMRASGEIQIECTRANKRTYFPQRNLTADLCQNYEYRCDAGTTDWGNVDENDEQLLTIKREEFRDDAERTNIIMEESGTVDADDPTLMYRRQFGAGIEGTEIGKIVHKTTIKKDGETNVFVSAPDAKSGLNFNVKPTGEAELVVGDPAGDKKMSAHVMPTGETTFNIGPDKAKVNIKPSGETTIDVGPGKSTITIKPSGEIEVKTSTRVQVTSPEINLNKKMSGITTEASHQSVIDFISGVPVMPSQTVFSDV